MAGRVLKFSEIFLEFSHQMTSIKLFQQNFPTTIRQQFLNQIFVSFLQIFCVSVKLQQLLRQPLLQPRLRFVFNSSNLNDIVNQREALRRLEQV